MGRGRWFIEFPGGGGVVKKRESPDFRSPEVGISAAVVVDLLCAGSKVQVTFHGSRVEVTAPSINY